MKLRAASLILVVAFGLTACRGAVGTGSLPAGPSPNGTAPARAKRAAGPPVHTYIFKHTNSAQKRHAHKARAHLYIKVPLKRKRHGRLVPAYISPSTASLAVAVDGGTPKTFSVTTTSPNCQTVGTGPGAYLACSFTVMAPVGDDVFSFTTYDTSGNPLSENNDVPFTVVAGSNTPLGVTLGGIPDSLGLYSVNNGNRVAFDTSTFPATALVYGNQPVTFDIYGEDADSNPIIGLGSPAITVTLSSGAHVTLTAPTGSSHSWIFTPTYNATDPTVPSMLTYSIDITPAANTGASPLHFDEPMALWQPWIYVTNFYDWQIGTTDEYGVGNGSNPKIVGGFTHVPNPSGIAYDP